jgi:hypothetical protein
MTPRSIIRRLGGRSERDLSPQDVLGPDHPLSHATAGVALACERCAVAAVLLTVGVLFALQGTSIGGPLALSAAVVLGALLARLAAVSAVRDRRALELIAAGRGDLPIRPVMRVRQRLLRPIERERLARTLDFIRTEAQRPAYACRVPPLYRVNVVRPQSDELAEVAALVRHGGTLRGLARTYQMVTDGCSPLYGDAEEPLRQELGQIRFLLAS